MIHLEPLLMSWSERVQAIMMQLVLCRPTLGHYLALFGILLSLR